MAFPYPVHDVQLTAEPLDGAANLQQLQSQSIVYGQAGRHSVGEVWQEPYRGVRGREEWEPREKGGWAEADLRRWWGESHPSGSHPTHGAASSLCSWATPVVKKGYGLVPRLLHMQLAYRRPCRTYRVIERVDPGWPWGQTGRLKLLLRKMAETVLDATNNIQTVTNVQNSTN